MGDVLEILKDPETQAKFSQLKPEDQLAWAWRANWLAKAHKHQIVPPGDWWSIWLMLAGRGAGKTRTAAEQIGWWAWTEPGTRWLVGAPTSSDVRSTCFEGDSGLLSVIPSGLVADYNRAFHELKLTNGSLIKGIPASEPERFRGPQFHGAWCCIAGTRILMADGTEKVIELVKPNEMVMTQHGPRKVLRSGISGNPNELVTIDCGVTSLTVTIDHPILIGDRWISAGDIRTQDSIWAISILAIGTHTESFGSAIMARFLKGGWFTTWMRTKAIMPLKTSWQCLKQNTSDFIGQGSQTQMPKSKRQPKLWKGLEPQSLPSAFTAMGNLSLIPQASLGSSVAGHASRSGVVTGLCRKLDIAKSAIRSIWPRSLFKGIAQKPATKSPKSGHTGLAQLEVKSVKRLPNTLTYNLTVEGEHEFIANGIVVHNCDELAAWDYLDEAWDQIMFSVRLGQKTKIICTTTPKPKDLIIDLFGRDGDDVTVTTASTYDNLANLSANFQKQILQYEGTKLGRQEIYAEIIDPEESGIVKREMFRLWPHDKAFPKFEYIVQSYDCAYTEKTINDPTACITWGVFKPVDGPMSVMVIDCWQDRLQYPDLRPKVIEEYDTIFGEGKDKKRVDLILVEDKSAGISLIQDLQRAHLPVRAYNPGNADKVQRLNIVSNIIARGRVWIPESSVRKGYVRDWAEPFVSQICSFPESTHDDFVDACLDSLTQVEMANGTKAIKDVRVGDKVMTPKGLRKVTAVHDNGYKEVWKVIVGGKEILATAEHRIMTNKGWIRVDALSQSVHNGYFIQGVNSWHFQSAVQFAKQLFSTARDITAILKAQTQRTGGTLLGLVQGCIGMFGSSTMVRSQTGCTSTILMETQLTTTSAILPVSRGKSIGRSTLPNIHHETKVRSNWLTLSLSGQKPLIGIAQRKVGLGIGNTPKGLSQRLGESLESIQRCLSSALGAAKTALAKARGGYFAGQPVKPPNLASGLVSQVINTHTMHHVYDLTVEGEHCYFANGILVHNCTQALRYLRDAGWLEIDPPPQEAWDEEDYIDSGIWKKRENPYAA